MEFRSNIPATLAYEKQIVEWGALVKKFENRELSGFTIDQIHVLLNQIQDFIGSWAFSDHFFQKVTPVMNSLFETSRILTGDAFEKDRQLSLEKASRQIYLALKTICL